MEITKSFYQKKDEPFSVRAYINPPADCAPVYGWVWNDKLEKEEIVKQLDEMQRLGIKKIYIIPEPKHFRPQTMPTDLEPEYLSAEYMEFCRFTVEECVKRDMTAWLYDEGGWPSGGACGKVLSENPALAKQGLANRTVKWLQGTAYFKAEDVLVAFVNGKQTIETGYCFSSDMEVDEYFIETYYYGVADYPDLLLTESTKGFIECTHKAYAPYLAERFGDTITAVFTDEGKGPSKYPFRKELVEAFEEKYGYSILPYLSLLMEQIPISTRQESQVFMDYYELCSEWYCKHYLLQERQWCNENGMSFTGHLDKDDDILGAHNGGCHYATLRALRCFDIPGIDVIWRQIWAEPHELKAKYDFFPRMASSAAAQNGAGKSMTETFGVYGVGLTYDEMRYVLGAQAIRGVNIFNMLTISYGRHNHYMAGELPSFTEAMYPDLKVFNEYVSRLSYLSSLGKMNNTVALYMPSEEIHVPNLRARIAESFQKCGDELERYGIPFDIFDDDFLRSVDKDLLKKGRLSLRLAEYTEIILPDCELLSSDSVAVLKSFMANGGKIYTVSAQVQEKLPGVKRITTFKDAFAFDERVSAETGILCQKRVVSNGTLLLFYNRTKDYKQISLKKREEEAYFLDVTNGKLYQSPTSIVLCAGETAGVLFTNEKFDAEIPFSIREERTLDGFTFCKTKRFSVGESNFIEQDIKETAKKVALGDWLELNGKDFTGSGIYETKFEYTGTDTMLLDCGDVRFACEVFVNNRSLGVKIMPPYTYELNPSLLKDKNTLAIRVTNTAANAFVYTDAFAKMEVWKLSPYFEPSMKFCQDTLSSGLFGPIKLYKKRNKS